MVAVVRPARPNGHGAGWELLLAREEQIAKWVAGGDGEKPLSIVKIEELLARQGCVVPYRTLHRFAVERCGFRVRSTTARINDGEPGVECQIDFAQKSPDGEHVLILPYLHMTTTDRWDRHFPLQRRHWPQRGPSSTSQGE